LKHMTCTRWISILLLALVLWPGGAVSGAEKLTAEAAGTIKEPTGRIAFIRNKNIWVMDARGQSQMMVCEATNAEGRLSWSLDARRIVFTRSGKVNFQSPAVGEGGFHKVYDLFLAYLDSADAGRANWWTRLTDELGSRNPEWTVNDRIILTRDMNANMVNAGYPNYQICLLDPESGNVEILRKDWQMMPEFFMAPSMNANGDIAFVHFYNEKPHGIAVLRRDQFMAPLDSVRVQSKKLPDAYSPAWSPDSKWIAYVNNSMTEPGLFLTTADLSSSYLVFEPPPGTYLNTFAASFSPDSKWLTFSTTDGSIWICDITGSGARRISGPGLDSAPAWSHGPAK